MRSGPQLALIWLTTTFVLACLVPGPGQAVGRSPAEAPQRAEQLTVQVIAAYPHDATSFTEGLLLRNGALYESGGLYGESKLEEADLQSGIVQRQIVLDPAVFGEGLAMVDDRLIQLTWKEQTAYVYGADNFEQ